MGGSVGVKMKKIAAYLDHILPVGPFSAAHSTL